MLRLYPAQRRLLVHQAVVAGRATGPRGERRVGEEAERAQPVVDRDDDDAVRRELRAVVVAAGVLGEAAAVDPHEHRPLARGDATSAWTTLRYRQSSEKGPGPAKPLGACGQLAAYCVASRTPLHEAGGSRCPPPQITGRCSCIGQPAEGVPAGDGGAADGAGVDPDDRGAGAAGTARADRRSAGGGEGQRGQKREDRCEHRREQITFTSGHLFTSRMAAGNRDASSWPSPPYEPWC